MDPSVDENAPKISIHGRIYEFPDLWDRGDDWTGVTGTAERKRRQNRLNQRAYRRRRKAQDGPSVTPENASQTPETPCSSNAITAWSIREKQPLQAGGSPSPRTTNSQVVRYDDSGSLLMDSAAKVARTRELIRQAYHDHSLRVPRLESLQMVIRLNLLNALARNGARMGFPLDGLCRDDFISPFNLYGPDSPCPWPVTASSSSTLPPSLQPTALQRTVLHHPWIDLLPFPTFRDNMLRVLDAGLFDDDDLCIDVLEVWAADLESRPSLMIWGESWDSRAWEASPSFMRKWGWLMKDCPDMIEATNFWREKRGQKGLLPSYIEDVSHDVAGEA